MDRVQAYRLLVDEMANLAQRVREARTVPKSSSISADVAGDGGALYRVELMVEAISDARFAVSGTIHDHNTHRFTLLEERIVFDLDREENGQAPDAVACD